MSEKRIVVPEGMLNVFQRGLDQREVYGQEAEMAKLCLGLALTWLSKNPIVPTDDQSLAVVGLKRAFPFDAREWVRWGAVEWQRRMFLAPEPEIPEEIMGLLTTEGEKESGITWTNEGHDKAVLEAYRRGQKAGSK